MKADGITSGMRRMYMKTFGKKARMNMPRKSALLVAVV